MGLRPGVSTPDNLTASLDPLAHSAEGIDLVERQSTRNDRDRDPQPGRGLSGHVTDQRPRALGTGAGAEDQDRDAGLLVDQADQLLAGASLANVDDRHRAGDRRDFVA